MASEDDTLRQLMLAAQAGDRQAYARLLRACQTWLTRYFARRIPPSQIDDLVQETLISVHRKRASYDGERAFLPWLAAIGRYRWIDHLRKVYRASETELDEALHAAPQDESVVDMLSVDALLLQLPDRQAEVIRLVKIAGYSISEAAARTGQSESLVKVNIHRGIRRMSAMIEKV
ncbi:MAG: sigma-70 family RNA polymerase sigma factor [Blastomonas sp.]|uniref:sigma-70 family RNA polymerase sigma factor n=1 Tax=Blastomonas TaxID=150203 RepID=UPI0024E1E226|nr:MULTISPECIES: sigma-70 family RNA polymerase sigma factor [Blastomonas]MCO5793513.1 sigma-70 family RNA polymerase sigma factor [Blastomonas sp.]MDK2755509.1 sigma-70 family RNA polymerase sigma factor [Blastomonas fulva]